MPPPGNLLCTGSLILLAALFPSIAGSRDDGTVPGTPPPARTSASATTANALVSEVASIASAGTPGPLAVFSDAAFVIAAGRLDQASMLPVAAGAAWEEGRVVALGHGGMIGAEALKHDGTARFVVNAVRWLAHDRRGSIGVLRNDAMIDLLRRAGFDAQALGGNWWSSLDNHAAIVVDSHAIGDRERDAVAAFIRNGGGLLTGGLGWGWLQLNPGRSIDDHPGNQLLRGAGIAWCDGTLETTDRGAFTTARTPTMTHAVRAMEAMEATADGDAPLDAQAGVTLVAACRVVPNEHALMMRFDELVPRLLATRAAKDAQTNGANGVNPRLMAPSQERPLRRKDALDRTLVAFGIEREHRVAPNAVVAHPAAAAFPGLVPNDAPRIARRVEIASAIPGWHGTGLYAPAGEIITVVPADSMKGLSLRIGSHTDHLWHLDRWDRVPDIVRVWPLGSETIEAASAFGGLIHVEVPKGRAGVVAFEIKGAVEAPRFVLGTTTDEQWRSLRSAPAPWGELESSKVIITVPSGSLRALEDPAKLMQFWDRISDAHATLAAIPLEPDRPHRFVADIQISAGYMHSGYPIMTHLDAAAEMTSLEKIQQGSWGLLHELGHNHQQGDWTFDGTVEVTCNLFSLHAIDTLCAPPKGSRGHGGVDSPPSLAAHLTSGAPFDAWKRDPFLALHMYVQLQRAFGWQTFQRVFAEYRALDAAQRPKGDDQKRDQWMVRFSRACERNLGPFFQAWGVPTSDAARASIADLPPWMPDDWPTPVHTP